MWSGILWACSRLTCLPLSLPFNALVWSIVGAWGEKRKVLPAPCFFAQSNRSAQARCAKKMTGWTGCSSFVHICTHKHIIITITITRKRPLTLGYFSFLKCLKLNANEGFVCRGNLHKCTDNHPSSSAKTLGASQGPIMGFAFAEGTSIAVLLKT